METDKLIIDGKIKQWVEGMPIGNGNIGGLLFGDGKKLVLSLDKGDIWDKSDSPEKDENFTYTNLIKLARQGNSKEIARIFDLPYNSPLPTKLPVGRLEFNLGKQSKQRFVLNLKTAEARYEAKDAYMATFIHSTKAIGMIKTDCVDAKLELCNPNFGLLSGNENIAIDTSDKTSRSLKDLRYPKPYFGVEKTNGAEIKYYIQDINNGVYYGVALASKSGKSTLEIAYTVDAGNNKEQLIKVMVQRVTDAIAEGYESLFESHKKWWDGYNGVSSLTLPDKELERNYNIGNYLLGCASRKGNYPMPLQGLWTACDDKNLPPWHGDYHLDLNVQMTYCSYLKANHLEEGECLIDYLHSLTDRAREFAKKSYNADGICLPSVMSIDGYALGGWAMYSLSPTNQLWLCQIIDRHYTHTCDEKFFKEVAYPYVSESAKFILSMLSEDADGNLVLPLSTSPEIQGNSIKSFLTPNTNYDQALIMYVFNAMVRYCKHANINAEVWETALSKLHPLAVSKDNVYMLSRVDELKESHRHQSHAMAIYPLKLINDRDAKNKAIITATLANAKKYGVSEYAGFSFPWLAQFCVANHDGNGAIEYIKTFYDKYCSRNTFHINFDCTLAKVYKLKKYGPFTLEANYCALDAMQDMLFYAEDGVVELFPSIPAEWKDVSFNGFRGYQGIIVSGKLAGGKLVNATIKATVDCSFTIINDLKGYNMVNGKEILTSGKNITLKAGETLYYYE